MKRFVGASVGAVATVFLAGQAVAQVRQPVSGQSATSSSGVEEIVVTAQKRAERLDDVPISISAASGDQLKQQNITTTADLGKIVPGFTFLQGNYGLPVFFIRGVGFSDTTLGVSPAVTVYVDQVPLPFSPMARGATLDLERVEVLKGPQGTLFGQNSTGGAINYIAAKPTKRLTAGLDAVYGRFGEFDVEGFVSGPLTDTLAARVAVRQETRGNWQRDYVNGAKLGEKSFLNARGALEWTPDPTVRFALTVSAWRDRSDVQQPQFQLFRPQLFNDPGNLVLPFPIETFPRAPDDARAASFDQDYNFQRRDNFVNVALRSEVDLSDKTTLTNIASYSRFKTFIPIDLDSTLYPLERSVTAGSIDSISEELRLAGNWGPLRWLVGGNYQHDKVDETLRVNPQRSTNAHVGPFAYNDFIATNDQRISTKSAFVSLEYELAPQLTLQGSARYTDQDRSFKGCTRDGGAGDLAAGLSFLSTIVSGTLQSIPAGSCVTLSSQTGTALPIVTGSLDESNVAWRGSVNYKITPTALLYANVTKGYKSGSFPTLPAAFSASYQPVKQESLLAYEVGSKVDLFQHRAQVNAAAFYYDYRDKQLVGTRAVPPFGILPALVSIPKSRIWGAEVGLRAQPFNGLTLDGGLTYLNTKIQSDPETPTGPFGGVGSFVGSRFPFTPRWQGTIRANYKRPVTTRLDGFAGATVSARSGVISTLYTNDPSVASLERLLNIRGYTTVDVRLGVETNNGAIRAELFGDNIFNRYYQTNINRIADFVYRFSGMPVTYGVRVSYRFGE